LDVALFRYGFDSQKLISEIHVVPVNPGKQLQLYEFIILIQLPQLKHGLEAHGSNLVALNM
jgi:hypothetical protein